MTVIQGQPQPVVLLNDTFADGKRDNQSLPASAAWYLLNDNASSPTATVNAQGELEWANKAGTYAGLIAFFTAPGTTQSLGIGDSLKLGFRMALDNLSNVNRVLRIGVMNSGGKRISTDTLHSGTTGLSVGTTFNDWRGYALLTAADAAPVTAMVSIVERSGVNSALWSSGAYAQIGAAVDSPSFIALAYQDVEFTITRRVADVEISGRLGDVTIGPLQDTAGLVTDFDTVALFVQPQINGLRVDDVKVTFIPNPVVTDDPNLVVLPGAVFGRLALDQPSPVGRISLKNSGTTKSLTIQSNSIISGIDASCYRILTPLPLVVAPGQTGLVEVSFSPLTRFGDFSAALELHSNDPSEPIIPVTLDTRYFHSGDQLLTNPGFEEPGLTNWSQAGTVVEIGGLLTNSTRAVLLNAGARVGRINMVVPGDFQLDFYVAIQDTANQAFEILLKTFPGFDRGNPFFDLRYQAGQFNVLSNGVWSQDLGLGSLLPSLDGNLNGELSDPEDTKNLYHFRLTAQGWGGDNPVYRLARSEANSSLLTTEVAGLTGFAGGGGGGAAPPVNLIFSAENNPGYWLDEVHLIAGLPATPSFKITTIGYPTSAMGPTITWESAANMAYRVETTTDVGGLWSALATGIQGKANTTSFTDTNLSGTRRFYRIVRQ